MLKRILKSITPPIVAKALRGGDEPNNCLGTYSSYEEAQKASEYYEAKRITAAVYEKTLAFRRQLQNRRPIDVTPPVQRVAEALGLVAGTSETVAFIDFGGALGTHYFIAKALRPDLHFRWHVVETPAVCVQGREFANDELRFNESLEDATQELGRTDLAYSDGVFQSLPDPQAYLARLLACRARYLCIRRMGLSPEKEIITVLKTKLSRLAPPVPLPPTIEDGAVLLPMTFLPLDQVEARLRTVYNIRLRFEDPKEAYRGLGFSVDMHGFFCELA